MGNKSKLREKRQLKLSVRITRYIALLSTDTFNHATLEARSLEQSKNKTKPQPWTHLNVTKSELWLNKSVWWPGSVIRSILPSEIVGLVTFHAIPSLLAIGVQSRFNPANKQYVVMLLRSGRHRDRVVMNLRDLCGTGHRVSHGKIQFDANPDVNYGYRLSQDTQIDIAVAPFRNLDESSVSGSEGESEACHAEALRELDLIPKPDTQIQLFASPLAQSHQSSAKPTRPNSVSARASIQGRSSVTPDFRPGMDPDLITYIMPDPVRGNMISDSGPVYIYCDH